MPLRISTTGAFMPVEDLVSQCIALEDTGLESVLWADHLMGYPDSLWTPDITPVSAYLPSPHYFYDVVATMATIAARTEQIQVGAITEMLRRHPAMLAQSWLTLDLMTGGRALVAVGAGEAENTTPFGIDRSRPVSKLEEGLEVVRLLWESDGLVDYDGEFFPMRDAALGLSPLVPGRYPAIWVTANGPRTRRITGRLADGWLPLYNSPDEYAARRDEICAAAQAAGRDLDDFTFSMLVFVLLADKEGEAEARLSHPALDFCMMAQGRELFEARGYEFPLLHRFNNMVDMLPTDLSREDFKRAARQVPDEMRREHYFHGTPDSIADRVNSYLPVGLNHIVLLPVNGLLEPEKSAEHQELFAALVGKLLHREEDCG